MRLVMNTLALCCLCSVLAWAGPGIAGNNSPARIPAVGTIAPAFGLFAFPTSGSLKKASSDDREIVQLDDMCGMRPGETKAVLVLFVDGDPTILGADPVGNWYRKYHKDGLEVAVISIEKNPSIFASKVLRNKPRYPILDDRHRVVATRYGVDKAPFSFLLNSECRVLGFNDKGAPETVASITAALEELVRGKPIENAEEAEK